MNYQASYGYSPPPRQRRGVKRMIFGILGILANAIGLVIMPIVAGLIAMLVTVIGASELTPLENGETTFDAEYWRIYSIAVPASELEELNCEINGEDIEVAPGDASYSIGQVDGVDYVEAYSISANSAQVVTVRCDGADSVAFYEAGMVGTFIAIGIGVVLPIALGFLAVVLTIWGAIALVRSS